MALVGGEDVQGVVSFGEHDVGSIGETDARVGVVVCDLRRLRDVGGAEGFEQVGHARDVFQHLKRFVGAVELLRGSSHAIGLHRTFCRMQAARRLLRPTGGSARR